VIFVILTFFVLKVNHIATGGSFLALVPFVNTLKKSVANSTGITLELDGSVTIKAAGDATEGSHLSFHTGLFNDAEFFSRFYEVPDVVNPFNGIKLALPGTLSAGSKFNFCLKDPKASRRDECRDGYKDITHHSLSFVFSNRVNPASSYDQKCHNLTQKCHNLT
jgi:hypothetical protein